jgi:proteasome lid subunit RPN8/RPN11
MAARLTPDLADAWRHCEATWPAEGVCALVFRPDGWRFVPLANVADDAHRADPSRFPRSAATSFVIDPLEWMALEREAADLEVWLVHSHVDGPATLSAWDLATFTIEGRPLLPRLRLAVLSIRDGRCVDEARWRFAAGAWTPCL